MKLVLSILMCPPGSHMDGQQYQFGEDGGSFGRAPDNTWVLVDPSRYVSSKHAEIKFDGLQFVLVDCSTNGTYLNEALDPVGMQSAPALKTGDVLQLGDYRLQVTVEQSAQTAPPMPNTGETIAAMPNAGLQTPAANPATQDSLDDLDKWLEPAAPAPEVASEPVPGMLDASAGQSVQPAGIGVDLGLGDEEKDPLAALGLGGQPSVSSSSQQTVSSDNTSLEQGSLSDLIQNTPPADQQMMRVPNTIPDDWDDLLGEAPNQQTPAPVSQAASFGELDPDATTFLPEQSSAQLTDPEATALNVPEAESVAPTEPASEMGLEDLLATPAESLQQTPSVNAPEPVPVPDTPKPAPSEPSIPQSAVSPGVAADELAQALGLTLNAEQQQVLNAKVAETVVAMVSGMMRTLRSRSEIKSEFRMNMTTIQSAENNPLKFSVTPEDALENMFAKSGKAYLSPVDAIEDGFADIADHQLALFEAMRAAYDNILNQFDPEGLENKFENAKGKGFLSGGKGKNWDLYKALVDEYKQDNEATFKRLFGDVFADAYERRMHSLKMNRKK